MLRAMSISIASIYRHPVKSLTAERLEQVTLAPGQAVPNDRRFALSLGSTPIEGASTEWMPKSKFVALVRTEKLAALETQFDDTTETLTILRDGKQVSRGKLTDAIGRISIEEFFGAYLGDEAKGRPKVVEAEQGHVLSDVPDPVLSILNLASVKDLERVTKKPVDPLRFRANLWLEGLEPWEEFTWVGREITVGGAKLAVTERIGRCPATNVNPTTSERDLNIPKALMMGFRHQDMGVYAQVQEGGEIKTGYAVEVGPPAMF
jgi:uncharacterized protein YcbX